MPVDVSPKPPTETATYLGDGLFAQFDGSQYEIYASNGLSKTNRVFMEPSVLRAFMRYVHRTETTE
jgi:hypothetical protein